MDEELINILKIISIREQKEIGYLSKIVNKIIKNNIKDEKIISKVFDSILSIVFVEESIKKHLFYKLSNYCRNFDKELADDYNRIYNELLKENDNIDNKFTKSRYK